MKPPVGGGFLEQQMLALDAANLNQQSAAWSTVSGSLNQQSKTDTVGHALNASVILGHENPFLC